MRCGAGIPVGDDAVRVEHEHRVVGDAHDQQLEAAFRLLALVRLPDQLGIGAGELGGSLGDLGLQAQLVLAQRLLDLAAALDLLLRRAIEPRLVDGDGGLRGDRRHDALGARVEHAGVGMAEEQAAQHLAGARHHRHREIAARPADGPCGMPWYGAFLP